MKEGTQKLLAVIPSANAVETNLGQATAFLAAAREYLEGTAGDRDKKPG